MRKLRLGRKVTCPKSHSLVSGRIRVKLWDACRLLFSLFWGGCSSLVLRLTWSLQMCGQRQFRREREMKSPLCQASPPSWCCFSHPPGPCLPGALGGIDKRIRNLMSLFAYSEDSSPATGSESNVYFLSIPAAESHTQTSQKNRPRSKHLVLQVPGWL